MSKIKTNRNKRIEQIEREFHTAVQGRNPEADLATEGVVP